MHRKCARAEDFGDFLKSQLSWVLLGRRQWLLLARGGLGQVSHEMGGGWKSQNRKNVYLSPYVEEPLNSKVMKKFRTWTKKLSNVFRLLRFLRSIYICYEHYERFAYRYEYVHFTYSYLAMVHIWHLILYIISNVKTQRYIYIYIYIYI